jgi:hypothetical protein
MGNWTSTKQLHPQDKNLGKLASRTGRPGRNQHGRQQTLVDFVAWAVKIPPANMLDMSDHGVERPAGMTQAGGLSPEEW